MDNTVHIYIDGQRVDLFQDENINIKLQAQKAASVDSSFSDFTQQFTIPATPNNNKILKHYYSFYGDKHAQDELIDAYINVNGLLFRTGGVSLDNAQLKSGRPASYSLTFFSKLTLFSEAIEDVTLRDLDFSASDFDYDPDDVVNSVQGNYVSNGQDDIMFPMILDDDTMVATTRLKNRTTDTVDKEVYSNNIMLDPTYDEHGVLSYADLKPAIKFGTIIDVIKSHFSVDFTGDIIDPAFGDQRDTRVRNIMMWMTGGLPDYYGGDSMYIPFTVDSYDPSATQWNVNKFVVPPAGLNDGDEINFTVTSSNGVTVNVFYDGVYQATKFIASGTTVSETIDVVDITDVSFEQYIDLPEAAGGVEIEFRIKIQDTADTITSLEVEVIAGFNYFRATANNAHLDAPVFVTISVSDIIPDMKVSDFLKGILQMFGATMVYESTTGGVDTFRIDKVVDMYTDVKDITNYIDNSDSGISTVLPYNSISFKHSDSDSSANKTYAERYSLEFGSSAVSIGAGTEEFKIDTPFEVLRWTMSGWDEYDYVPLATDALDADVDHYGYRIAYKANGGSSEKPVIFYADNTQTKAAPFSYSGNIGGFYHIFAYFIYPHSATPEALDNMWYCGDHRMRGVFVDSASVEEFSLTFDEHYYSYFGENKPTGVNWRLFNSTSSYGELEGKNLYSEYWSGYIQTLVETGVKKITLTAHLPYSIVKSIDATNILQIRDRYYTIDDADININTGKATLTLISNGHNFI